MTDIKDANATRVLALSARPTKIEVEAAGLEWAIGAGRYLLNLSWHGVTAIKNSRDSQFFTHRIVSFIPTAGNPSTGYRVAYCSIPLRIFNIAPRMQRSLEYLNCSFIGPGGKIEQLPGGLSLVDEILETRIYVGWDWDDGLEPTTPVRVIFEAFEEEMREHLDDLQSDTQ